MSYFVFTDTEAGWDCVRGIYQAESEQDVKDYIEEEYLELTNDPEKAEEDREHFWDRHVLTEKKLIVI